MEAWKEEFILQGQPKDTKTFPFIILGNKADLAKDRKTDKLKAQQWCKEKGNLKYFETSAKTSEGVEEAFKAIAEAASVHDAGDM